MYFVRLLWLDVISCLIQNRYIISLLIWPKVFTHYCSWSIILSPNNISLRYRLRYLLSSFHLSVRSFFSIISWATEDIYILDKLLFFKHYRYCSYDSFWSLKRVLGNRFKLLLNRNSHDVDGTSQFSRPKNWGCK